MYTHACVQGWAREEEEKTEEGIFWEEESFLEAINIHIYIYEYDFVHTNTHAHTQTHTRTHTNTTCF